MDDRPDSAPRQSAERPRARHRAIALALGGALVVLGASAAQGAALTAAYAASRSWATVVPPLAVVGGVVAAVAIGALAGLYPALRAARLVPTEALRSV